MTLSGSPLGAGLLLPLISSATSPGRMSSGEEGEELCRGRRRRPEIRVTRLRKAQGNGGAPEQGGSHGLLLPPSSHSLSQQLSLLSSAFGFPLAAASANIFTISAARESPEIWEKQIPVVTFQLSRGSDSPAASLGFSSQPSTERGINTLDKEQLQLWFISFAWSQPAPQRRHHSNPKPCKRPTCLRE